MQTQSCRFCNAQATRVGQKQLLKKHLITYYLCPSCDLLQTEAPYWLSEAYSDAIAAQDVGAMSRTERCVQISAGVSWCLGIKTSARCLDYGGGPGTFVRLMRDRGFDFFWNDRYCHNIYAKGFEGNLDSKYELVTCFEVLEHLENVADELATLFRANHRYLLVGTLQHFGFQKNWWYLAPASGQHISFYSDTTLKKIAERFGYSALCGHEVTLFVHPSARLSHWKRVFIEKALIRRPNWAARLGRVLLAVAPRPSLAPVDALQFVPAG